MVGILEIWKPISNSNGKYEVSNTGKVRALDYQGTGQTKELKLTKDRLSGYMRVRIKKADGKTVYALVHRLVADAFIDNKGGLPCVNHMDEDKTNNNIANLEWCTYKYNSNYGTATDRANKTKKNRKKAKNF